MGEEAKLYIGSADIMTRNTQRRVEIACPVLDPEIRRRIYHDIQLFCADNVKARVLEPDGTYRPVPRQEGEPAVDCQAVLMAEAMEEADRADGLAISRRESHGPLKSLMDRLASYFHK